MNKKIISRKVVAMCLLMSMIIMLLPVTSYAKAPTIDTVAQELTIGKNQLTFRDYSKEYNTLLGVFTVPENGKYTFSVTNNGSVELGCCFMNEDLATIEYRGILSSGELRNFETYSLKKGETYYFYVESEYWSKTLLAANINITKIQESKPELNKTSISVKQNSKVTLKLKNNKKKVVWVSSNKSIATVSAKGVVTAKKKGTAYVYAIVGSKAYKCKVAVYN